METSLDVFLPPFGDGADINGISSTVSFVGKQPTHYVVCSLNEPTECVYTGEIQQNLDGFYFDKFVNDDFEVEPVLNYVSLADQRNNRRVLWFDKVSFYLKRL